MQWIEIKIAGHLDKRWHEWFEGLEWRYTPEGDTLVSGPIQDQSALYGIIGKLRDLGATLISVAYETRDG